MFLIDKEQQVLDEVKQFLRDEVTPDLVEESMHNELLYGAPLARGFIPEFARQGWLVPTWPKEHGGLESSQMLAASIRHEMAYARIPMTFPGAFQGGPTILKFGSEDMKAEFLPRLASGEIEFALGYSEPGAGSDLMGLKMLAEDKGDYFQINGQKIFTTQAHIADYVWLAACTNPEGRKSERLSLFIVDLDTPGITIHPMITMAGTRTNTVFYDDVKVDKRYLVGEKNQGYRYIRSALEHERMFPYGHEQRFFEELVDYTKTATRNGEPLAKNPLIRQRLAEHATELEVIKHLYYNIAALMDQGKSPVHEASMEKLFLSEFEQRMSVTAMDILGHLGQLKAGNAAAPLNGLAEYYYRWNVIETIYGGTSEIQRNIIANRGLQMPRA
jgi:alkylation response protein AidB-like acyl-CoA dehydrogenase